MVIVTEETMKERGGEEVNGKQVKPDLKVEFCKERSQIYFQCQVCILFLPSSSSCALQSGYEIIILNAFM